MKLLKGLDDFQESIERMYGYGYEDEFFCDCCGPDHHPAEYESTIVSVFYSRIVDKLQDRFSSMPGVGFEESNSWFKLGKKR